MKKTIKIVGLLFAAAMVLAGCTQPTSSSSPNYNEPLFSENDVTVDATKYEIADGSWVFREIDKDANSSSTEHYEFVIKNGKLDYESDMKYITTGSGTIPEGTSQAQIDAVKKVGYNIDGNKYSYTKEYDKDAILKLLQKMSSSSSSTSSNNSDPELMYAMKIMVAVGNANSMNGKNTPRGCKTNAEKTKYWWKSEYTNTTPTGTTTTGSKTNNNKKK